MHVPLFLLFLHLLSYFLLIEAYHSVELYDFLVRAICSFKIVDVVAYLIDSEQAYNEAYNFVKAVMPRQLDKLKTYTLNEPLFAHFAIESQIQTAYEREVKLPSGGSIVIDQTEALVSIDINSAKSTRGSDVEDTALLPAHQR